MRAKTNDCLLMTPAQRIGIAEKQHDYKGDFYFCNSFQFME
jgi:hypothetical protein